MRRLLVGIAVFLLVVLAIGVPLVVLESAPVTRALTSRYSDAQTVGLPPQRMLELAEQVRAFVVAGKGTLPNQVDGRSGFDASAVSHLADVRQVLRGAHLLTGLIAAVLAVWLGWAVARRRLVDVASVLKFGSIATVGPLVLAAAFALSDFEWFFSAFHGLFFRAGTWTFPFDSLLIQLFPEPFWAVLGAAWAALVGLMAVTFGLAGVVLSRNAFAPKG
ncbi:MAG: hypothetical protein CVT67_03725 [Actinobacteria bacterium HGW-Actinobacteria-7]|nr:MAG: hypothetical protein CVT67_03725 [Actinobacteria bacterium HGW-Actinobacteria-7]